MENSKEIDTEVLVKRSRRIVQKYTIPSKAGSSAKVATTTRKRKSTVTVMDADSRPFIDHLMVDMELLRDHVMCPRMV